MEIVESTWQDTVEEENFSLGKPTNLKRQANRVRKSKRPKEPTDIMFEIDTEYIGQEFLRHEVTVDDHRHLVFYTDQQLDLLRLAKRWFLDGTFKIVKKPFVQMWSIHSFVHSSTGEDTKQVPLVFVLMTRRTAKDYEEVLKAVKEAMETFVVEAAVMDFEIGAWQAIRRVFPVSIQGCVFHWGQAIWRKVQSVGLQETYFQRQTIYNFVRQLMALPFLPAQHMAPTFQIMRLKANTQQLTELVTYMQQTWFTSTIWQTESLSVFKFVVRTNNDVEGWHFRMNKRAAGQGLPFYVLVPFLKKEATIVATQVRLVQDNLLCREQRSKFSRIQANLEDLWTKYTEGTLTTSVFLTKAARCYRNY